MDNNSNAFEDKNFDPVDIRRDSVYRKTAIS